MIIIIIGAMGYLMGGFTGMAIGCIISAIIVWALAALFSPRD